MPAATEAVDFNQQDVTRFQNRPASSMPQFSSGSSRSTTTASNSSASNQQQHQSQHQQRQQDQDEPRRWIKRYRTQVSASSASVLSTITAFPLDSVKTRLQTYPYNGFLHCVGKTYHSEGIRGFFRGTLPIEKHVLHILIIHIPSTIPCMVHSTKFGSG
jgi:hypothetical protein